MQSPPQPLAERRTDLRPGALIVGGALGALAVARSLGRCGIPACFLTHDHPVAAFSRYVRRSFTWAGPDAPGALATLCRLVAEQRLEGWLLIVCGDTEVRFVAQNHAALANILRLSTPPWDITRWTHDKRLTYQRAAEIGIDVPWSHYPRDGGEIAQLDCRFPVILKPSVREHQNAFTQAKAWRADNRAALIARYRQAASLVGEDSIVLQEMIPGSGEQQFSFAALCDEGGPVAWLVARRTRQYPIDFGYTSTFVETIENAEVEQAARRILHALGLSGFVEVEFKFDRRDGRYKLLDINARPWAWIGLGAAAGIDFPVLAWRLAHGETIAPVRARPGIAWMHAPRDVVALLQESGVRGLSRWSAGLCRPLTFAAFAKDDPLPALIELPLVGMRVLRRRLPTWFHGMRKAQAIRTHTSL